MELQTRAKALLQQAETAGNEGAQPSFHRRSNIVDSRQCSRGSRLSLLCRRRGHRRDLRLRGRGAAAAHPRPGGADRQREGQPQDRRRRHDADCVRGVRVDQHDRRRHRREAPAGQPPPHLGRDPQGGGGAAGKGALRGDTKRGCGATPPPWLVQSPRRKRGSAALSRFLSSRRL